MMLESVLESSRIEKVKKDTAREWKRESGVFLNVREKKKIKEGVGGDRDRLDTCVGDKNKKKEKEKKKWKLMMRMNWKKRKII